MLNMADLWVGHQVLYPSRCQKGPWNKELTGKSQQQRVDVRDREEGNR